MDSPKDIRSRLQSSQMVCEGAKTEFFLQEPTWVCRAEGQKIFSAIKAVRKLVN